MMLAPTGIVLGRKKLRTLWTALLDWLEWKRAPQVVQSRQRLPLVEREVTRLERLVDQLFP